MAPKTKRPTQTKPAKKAATKKRSAKKNAPKAEEEEKFVEPSTPWAKSNARKQLYEAIMAGEVPINARKRDQFGRIMQLKTIFESIPELGLYDYQKLSSRLSNLCAEIQKYKNRATLDQQAFDVFRQLHPPAQFSKRGYIQWQGSEAKKQLKRDIEAGLLQEYTKFDLWELRPVYYRNFPLKEFRDKIAQTIRTAKYMHTLEVRGKLHKAS